MRLLTLISLFVFTTPLLAGGQATIRSGGSQEVDIAWNGDKVRMDVRGQQAYILVLDGTAYSVANAGGQLMVMDLSSIPQHGARNATPEAVARITRLEDTGAEETVAGIEGDVYEMAWTDGQGNAHEGEAVLTDDELVREMQEAFWIFSQAMTKQDEEIGTRLREEGLATLRVGQDFVLVEINADTRPDGDFTLPAKPMDMQQMMRGMGQ